MILKLQFRRTSHDPPVLIRNRSNMFFTQNLTNNATRVIEIAKKKNLKLVIAESCTGGLLAALFTEIPGSSQVIERGFVVYSNEAKTELLQVKKSLIDAHGAVSTEVAEAMAQGALKNSRADIAIAITGIAGPDGGSKEKPVGLVYIAVGCKKRIQVRKFNFSGIRQEVRKSALLAVFEMLRDLIMPPSTNYKKQESL